MSSSSSSWTWAHLGAEDITVLDAAWKAFMADFRKLSRLVPIELRQSVVTAGQRWEGRGYGVFTFSRLIFDLCGRGVLASSFDAYRNVILVALALYWQVQDMPIIIEGEAKDAAFAICASLTKEDDEKLKDIPKDNEETPVAMPWALSTLPLPETYKRIMGNLKHSLEDADRARLLRDVPFFGGLPRDAPINNHHKDSSFPAERVHRAWENEIYKALRLLVQLDISLRPGGDSDLEPEELCERLFSMLFDVSLRIQEYRKGRSIPNAVATKNPLFSKEDLALARTANDINKQRPFRPSKGSSSSQMNQDSSGRFGGDRRDRFRNNHNRNRNPQGGGGYKGNPNRHRGNSKKPDFRGESAEGS